MTDDEILEFSKYSIRQLKERLESFGSWFPYPAIISLGLVLILNGHLITYLNPRLGTKVDVINFPTAGRLNQVSLWLGIKKEKQSIEITTSDRQKFIWKNTQDMQENLEPLIRYLSNKVEEKSYSAGLKMRVFIPEITAVLAVDKSLTYSQIQPVIVALAAANISKYGFETKLLQN